MSDIVQHNAQPQVLSPIAAAFDFTPRSLDEALRYADALAQSELIPKEYQRKPANILVAMQWGNEIGLKTLQAMQNIAVINGRPSLWGDAMIALVLASPVCEYVVEEDKDGVAICRAKRRGAPEQTRTFSVEDAKTAGLAGKSGPWTNYPKRMRQLRARAFALRDVFTDVLRGMPMAEELMDIPAGEMPRIQSSDPVQPEAPQPYSTDEFDAKFPEWESLISSGKKGADYLIKFIQSKKPLTEQQQQKLRAVKVAGPQAATTEGDQQ